MIEDGIQNTKIFPASSFYEVDRHLTFRIFRRSIYERTEDSFYRSQTSRARRKRFILLPSSRLISGNRYFPFARHPFDPLTSSRSIRDWYWRSQFAISTTLFARRDVCTRTQYGHCWQRKRNSICRFRFIPSLFYTFGADFVHHIRLHSFRNISTWINYLRKLPNIFAGNAFLLWKIILFFVFNTEIIVSFMHHRKNKINVLVLSNI